MEDNAKTIINVAGDYVQSKHVDYEINNVEAAVRGHAVSWWFCYRLGAHHCLLPRHRQRQGMFDVPPRHQPRSALIENPPSWWIFYFLSATLALPVAFFPFSSW